METKTNGAIPPTNTMTPPSTPNPDIEVPLPVNKSDTTPVISPQAKVTESNTTPLVTPHPSTEELLIALSAKVDNIEKIVLKMKRHNTISMWLTIIFVVLPIAISVFALPYIMSSFTSSMGLSDLSAMTVSQEETEDGAQNQSPIPAKQVSDAELINMLHSLQAKVEANKQ